MDFTEKLLNRLNTKSCEMSIRMEFAPNDIGEAFYEFSLLPMIT